MHESVRAYVAEMIGELELDRAGVRVLEVGSLDVNGGVRDLFTAGPYYIGCDARPGPGVDYVVTPGQPFPFGIANFDAVVSTEMLEHDPRPWLTMLHIADALRAGGVAIITTRGFGFGPHDHGGDYWRFSEQSLGILMSDAGLTVAHIGPDPDPNSPGVFATAFRE